MPGKTIPFEFVLEYLHAVDFTIKPMFGMTGIYRHDKVLLMLRQSDKKPESNGIWVAVTKAGVASITKDIQGFRNIPHFKESDSPSPWLLLSPGDDEFEKNALKICELIRRSDPRIGRVPKQKVSRKK